MFVVFAHVKFVLRIILVVVSAASCAIKYSTYDVIRRGRKRPKDKVKKSKEKRKKKGLLLTKGF